MDPVRICELLSVHDDGRYLRLWLHDPSKPLLDEAAVARLRDACQHYLRRRGL